MTEIPEVIKEAFADTSEAIDGKIVFAGSKDGVDYYVYEFHEEVLLAFRKFTATTGKVLYM